MDKKDEKFYGIILAGGTGSRMGSDIPKQFLDLEGKPVLQYSIEAFEKSAVDGFIIVVNEAYRDACEEILSVAGAVKFAGFAENGSERVWSVKNGLDKVRDICIYRESRDIPEVNDVYVLIHDGARPLITAELINDCINAVRTAGACVPALELKDTVKTADKDMYVTSTPDRSTLRAVQTPQCFLLDLILEAYGKKEKDADNAENFIPTDDASMVERYTDTKVLMIPGNEKNLKITTPTDMQLAQILLQNKDGIQQ